MNEPELVGAVAVMAAALGSTVTILAKGLARRNGNGTLKPCPYHQRLAEDVEKIKDCLSDPKDGVSVQLARLNQHIEFILKERKDSF